MSVTQSAKLDEAERVGAPGRWEWLFRKEMVGLAWVAVIVGALLPERGIGLSFCGMYLMLHVPCPACGMTRSVSCFFRGDWGLSWAFHPMGWMAGLASVAVASSVVWPSRWKRAARRWTVAHDRAIWYAFWGLFGVWLLYGVARIALVASGVWQFPPA